MSRISVAFFGAAVLYALASMSLGVLMATSQDHTLALVHTHMDLLGWVSLALMGAFYGLAGDLTPPKLAWLNFVVSNLGNLITLPLLSMLLQGDPSVGLTLGFGEALVVIGMLIFGGSIVAVWRRAPAAIA